MSQAEVTRDGLRNVRPDREAMTGANVEDIERRPSSRQRVSRGEQAMVPAAEFRSYYGKPIINEPAWEGRDIAGYLFLGGLAGAGSVVAAAAQVTQRPALSRTLKVSSMTAVNLSLVALIHDLGRRARFINMLRTFKPTSPMNIGSWLLSAFGPAATVAALSDVTGVAPLVGGLATAGAAALGPAVASYTAALICDTAVPAWHDAYRDMPFVFAASAVTSAAAVGLVASPEEECAPVRVLGVVAGAAELLTDSAMEHRMGIASEAFKVKKAKRYHHLARGFLLGGILATLIGRGSRAGNATGGACLLLASALTRFAIFEAGLASARDPKYTVVPQRHRDDRARGGRRSSE